MRQTTDDYSLSADLFGTEAKREHARLEGSEARWSGGDHLEGEPYEGLAYMPFGRLRYERDSSIA